MRDLNPLEIYSVSAAAASQEMEWIDYAALGVIVSTFLGMVIGGLSQYKHTCYSNAYRAMGGAIVGTFVGLGLGVGGIAVEYFVWEKKH